MIFLIVIVLLLYEYDDDGDDDDGCSDIRYRGRRLCWLVWQ